MRTSVLVALVGAVLAGAATSAYFAQTDPDTEVSQTAAPEFSLPDVNGVLRSSKEWQGQVVLVNFWAPWCPPCRREIPALVALQRKYAERGLTIVGITLDTPQNTRDFALASDIAYPLLIAEDTGPALARRFGNSVDGLPFTAIVDRSGRIVHTRTGEISRAEAENAIKSLL